MTECARPGPLVRSLVVLIGCGLALGGCASGPFYAQAIGGHLGVVASAQPVERVLEESTTPAALAERLRLAARIRDFASEALGLPDNASYRSYASLGRPAVVWNVFAAPEFSLQSRRWCYPVAGCVIYRGFFDPGAARVEAGRLREREGLQTWIAAVPAYSTLGWTDDPLLDTFIFWPEPELAGLIFHELAHQVVYVRGDTTFNESYAVAVEIEGVRRWLRERGDPQAALAHERRLARREQRRSRLLAHRAALEALYASGAGVGEMREQRAALERGLLVDLDALAEPGAPPAVAPNNAQLGALAAYASQVPAFQALLAREGGDFAAFHRAVRAIARLPAPERGWQLEQALRLAR